MKSHTERRPTDGVIDYLPGILQTLQHHSNIFEQINQSNKGVLHRGSGYYPIRQPAGGKMSVSPGRLAGYSIRDLAGGAGSVIRIRDGVDVGGDLMVTVMLGAGLSETKPLDDVAYASGLYIEVVSGSIEGALYYKPR